MTTATTRSQPDQFFKLLADATRLRCLLLLRQQGELCVCELTAALDMSQPKISRHLALLRSAGLVVDRRDATWVYYRLSDGLPAWQQGVLATVASQYCDQKEFAADIERSRALEDSSGRRLQCTAAGISSTP